MTASFWPDERSNLNPEWNPNQLEIQYFWPLTEQISLDLDYSECVRPRYSYSDVKIEGGTGVLYQPLSVGTWAVSSQLELNKDGLTFNGFEMPWYRKVLFKLMGFKWK